MSLCVMLKPWSEHVYTKTQMYQIILVIVFLLIAWQILYGFLGWTGKVVRLPAYHLSLIRNHVRKRNVVHVQGFLTEDAKDEYDSMYEYLNEQYDSNTDLILHDTTLSQISDCMEHIPVMLYHSLFRSPQTSYTRILNTKTKLVQTKRMINSICAIQPMDVVLKQPNQNLQTIHMDTGDLLILPNHTKYGFSKGTIDYFSYFK